MRQVLFLVLLTVMTHGHCWAQASVDPEDEMAQFHTRSKYSDYKVPVYTGRCAAIDRSSNITARRYKTALKEGYRQGVNFAGHYCLVVWGCGSPCRSGAIIDARNGKVYDLPYAGGGYDFKRNSRMLYVNPPDNNGYYFKNRPYDVPELYVLNEQSKKFKRIK